MSDLTIQQTFALALRHHQAGRLAEAEPLYQQVLAQQPEHPNALILLGMIANQTRRNDVAEALTRRAISIRPDFPEAYCNLGIVLRDAGRLDEAIAAFRRAVALRPGYADGLCNLGNVLKEAGLVDEAVAAFRDAIAANPKLHQAFYNLGITLRDKGELDEAIAAYRQAIAINPQIPEAHNNLGLALIDKGQIEEAIAAFGRAINLRFDIPQTHNNLGIALESKGQIAEAVAAYRQAVALRPDYPEAYCNLGSALKEIGALDEAVAACRRALALRPDFPEAYNNLGYVLKERGELDESIAACRKAVALMPAYVNAHSNLVYTMYFHPGYDARAIADEHRRWNRQHAEPLRAFIPHHANDRDPDRKLRIGYVSPDFCDHVVGQNLFPLFLHHDRSLHEIFCYAHVIRPDALTARFQQNADGWRDIVGLGDEEVARQIFADRIDILVDLSLHMAHNRLLVFARKPAPVQVTYLGYCASTGLDAIDYRLSDPYLDPPDSDLSVYTEQTIRLPETYWCYGAAGAAPDPSPPPSIQTGTITFGCLNNFAKVSRGALDVWAEILQAVPNSRLILHAYPGSHRDEVRARFTSHGVSPDRLEFLSKQSWPDYVCTYNRIDIALDPFPYGGGITTCDALWTGVPVVSLIGQTAVGRGGKSILSNIGLAELAAQTAEQYVQIAINVAGDTARLKELRSTLRQRMRQSPLMDGAKFARNIEAAYRLMWHTRCQKPRQQP